jgi:hypothetical protein
MTFAGLLNKEEGLRMLESVEECRRVDTADWE